MLLMMILIDDGDDGDDGDDHGFQSAPSRSKQDRKSGSFNLHPTQS